MGECLIMLSLDINQSIMDTVIVAIFGVRIDRDPDDRLVWDLVGSF